MPYCLAMRTVLVSACALTLNDVASPIRPATDPSRFNIMSSPQNSPTLVVFLTRQISSRLHAPTIDGVGLDSAEDDVLDDEPDNNDGKQAREHGWDVEAVLVFENKPTKTAGARRDA